MQAVQQSPKFGERSRRSQSRPNGEIGALCRVGNPRWEPADGAVGQLAENVLTFWELRTPVNTKTLTL
jgi:hypothetical protein